MVCIPAVLALKILYICAGSTEPSLLVYPFMKLLASTRECEQLKRRSVCASAQSHKHPCCSLSRKHIGLVETKPCFGVPIKRDFYQSPQLLRLATKIEISLVANLDIIVSTKRLKAKGLCLCCSKNPEDRFSHVETHIMPACYMRYFYI